MALAQPTQPKILLVARAFIVGPDDKLLFAKRSLIDPRHPGLWECPGGKVDPGEDMLRALLREIGEETGFIVQCLRASAHIVTYPIRDGKYRGRAYEAHFNICRIVGGALAISHEHEAFAWVTHAESLELNLTPEVRSATIALREHLA